MAAGAGVPYVHCLLSDLVLVALAHPTWPVWFVTVLALVMPVMLVVAGGSGKERVHVAAVLALAAPYIMQAAMAPPMYTGKGDAVLARDRLVLGDIQNQGGDFPAARAWPTARELGGNDAASYPPPAVVAARALDAVSEILPAYRRPQPGRVPETLTKKDVAAIEAVVDRALATELPRMDTFLLGVAPNRAGAASAIGLILAGLYLSYRYILRPRSVVFFGVFFVLGTAAFTFTPGTVGRTGVLALGELVGKFPGEILTLFNFLLMNSDAAFAAVIILALPGTEPLTPRGRRVFLALAAVGAAWVHRLDPAVPAATLALCADAGGAGVRPGAAAAVVAKPEGSRCGGGRAGGAGEGVDPVRVSDGQGVGARECGAANMGAGGRFPDGRGSDEGSFSRDSTRL